jgi:hypothetical protein
MESISSGVHSPLLRRASFALERFVSVASGEGLFLSAAPGALAVFVSSSVAAPPLRSAWSASNFARISVGSARVGWLRPLAACSRCSFSRAACSMRLRSLRVVDPFGVASPLSGLAVVVEAVVEEDGFSGVAGAGDGFVDLALGSEAAAALFVMAGSVFPV